MHVDDDFSSCFACSFALEAVPELKLLSDLTFLCSFQSLHSTLEAECKTNARQLLLPLGMPQTSRSSSTSLSILYLSRNKSEGKVLSELFLKLMRHF